MIGEGHRWMDLTRTTRRVRQYNPARGLNIQDYQVCDTNRRIRLTVPWECTRRIRDIVSPSPTEK